MNVRDELFDEFPLVRPTRASSSTDNVEWMVLGPLKNASGVRRRVGKVDRSPELWGADDDVVPECRDLAKFLKEKVVDVPFSPIFQGTAQYLNEQFIRKLVEWIAPAEG